jgi:hypothetical protein
MADRPSAKLLTGLLVVSSAAVSLRGTQVVVATLDKDCRKDRRTQNPGSRVNE